ncbi:CHAT domain-containing protein [Candidatus Eisenbacteria bacterium]|uniref:CHAT domain-containing protein n=1 Tax=Eiseniibacteriota bacterium TaxID=2212470 RepID=A0ABV6YK23_UNCEI
MKRAVGAIGNSRPVRALLSRAFLYAGARNVVASLWQVSGEATAVFMQHFYEHLQREDHFRSTHALAEAKRRMINGESSMSLTSHVRGGGPDAKSDATQRCLAHLYFWSAFVVTGDGI